METFEFIERLQNKGVVQIGTFKRVLSPNDINIGDSFICPQIDEYNGLRDKNTGYPILLYVTYKTDTHIGFQENKERKTGGAAIYHTHCYKPIE